MVSRGCVLFLLCLCVTSSWAAEAGKEEDIEKELYKEVYKKVEKLHPKEAYQISDLLMTGVSREDLQTAMNDTLAFNKLMMESIKVLGLNNQKFQDEVLPVGEFTIFGAARQYLYWRADFGDLTDCNVYPIKVAEPFDACKPFTNAKELEGSIVMVERGVCPFTLKAENIQQVKGVAMVVVNTVDGLFRMPQNDSFSINIPSVMIFKRDGKQILESYHDGVSLMGSLIGRDLCKNGIYYPESIKETILPNDLTLGGMLHYGDKKYVFLSARFSGIIPLRQEIKDLAIPSDEYACGKIDNVKGKWGKCNYSYKSDIATIAGAKGIILVNNVPGLIVPDTIDDVKDMSHIPFIAINSKGSQLIDDIKSGKTKTITLEPVFNSTTLKLKWNNLNALQINPSMHPKTEAAGREMIANLHKEYDVKDARDKQDFDEFMVTLEKTFMARFTKTNKPEGEL